MTTKFMTALDVAYGLINAGTEIVRLLKSDGAITDEELQAIIDRENTTQADARARLAALLEKE